MAAVSPVATAQQRVFLLLHRAFNGIGEETRGHAASKRRPNGSAVSPGRRLLSDTHCLIVLFAIDPGLPPSACCCKMLHAVTEPGINQS
ncbi:hypothetical protein EYF80_030173 [Liparis tanakae]|uniref:Uncharacterized protein n=1 Tax=Liparis tanakae TaxID=230148 RepID=A0A4Z2H1Z7_9TELE|nr:hypothetical protein EYF80_030173 [Liparis tanakae]